MLQKRGEKDPEEGGHQRQNAALFHTALDVKGPDLLPSYCTVAFVLWWKDLIMLCSFGGHPIFTSILKSPSRSFPADQVKRFREVNEGDVHRLSFCCSLHLNCSYPNLTLTLNLKLCMDMFPLLRLRRKILNDVNSIDQ